MTMKNNTNPTAAEAYAKHAADMRLNLGILTAWLDQIAPASEAANWGDVGDLARVNSLLEDIHEYLGRNAD